MSWVKDSLLAALTVIDNERLVKAAGLHVQPDFEATDGAIRPSLISQSCRLQRLKNYRGHTPQPGGAWLAARQGRPSAGTNITFARGFLGEGLVVAALKFYAELLKEYEVIGCAPGTIFSADPDFEAHPDLVVIRQGEVELIQIKTPSVWAFQRYDKGDTSVLDDRYAPQAIAEMVIGRKMGIPVVRNTVLLVTWEGWPPGVLDTEEVRCLAHEVQYVEGMEEFIDELAEDIRNDAIAVAEGHWPAALPQDAWNKFPCSYCSYARVQQFSNQVTCEENDKWELAFSPSSSSAGSGAF